LRMVGNKLTAKDEEEYRNKGTHKPRSPRRWSLQFSGGFISFSP
jgi:hypothetical protein